MNYKPSKYQIAVYNHITDGQGNAVIDAVAGSGKSTTIVNALKLIPATLKVLFLAFNKAIVEELKIKIGQLDNTEIKTLHSLGMSAIIRTFKTRVDASKYKTYINNALKYGGIKPIETLEWEDMSTYKINIMKLVDLARVNLCHDPEDLREIAAKHGIWVLDNEAQKALEIVSWGSSESNLGTIDFTDMIYLPNILNIELPVFDFVFIDECQDLNTAQRELFLKCVKPTGRFIAVGDPRQAIYGFAGADIESFEMLKAIENTVLLPLSVCYRSDEAIINLAKTIVPQIEARDGAPEGIIDREAKVEDIQDGDMVLCRVSAPLIALCMQYISTGIKAYVRGRDIGANLINMINKTKRRYLKDTLGKLDADLQKVCNAIVKRMSCSQAEAREESQYTAMADKIQAIRVLAKDLKTTDAVVNRITAIFKDDQKSGICLSTVHKAKGLESNKVFIIREDKFLLPHCMKKAWMAEQEYNLVYVAYTRAKHYLGFVTDFQMDAD
jgi:superfamily I DNA/RNA helicase